jgi:branched-chain amino acid transport system ATP-binding protein
MLDEPSQGIMPKLVDEIFGAIQSIRSAGVTIILVEQRLADSLEIADRAIILRTGRIIMQGTAAEVRDHPEIRSAYLGI